MKAFECKMCGSCCYGEGGIFLQKEEIIRIATFLEMTPESFITQFCIEEGNRLSIKTGADNFCIFYDKEKNCTIHHVKPSPCTLWPFYSALLEDLDNWEVAKDACPGINPDCAFETFVKQSKG
jgi:Fe-S-cluster containining protein